MPITEDTVTDWLAEYLRGERISCDTHTTPNVTIPKGLRNPDIWIENQGIFLGEAEWENSEPNGWRQAHDYLEQCPEASGCFLIIYPNEIKRAAEQRKLVGKRSDLLGDYKYKVAFLRPRARTDFPGKLKLEEIPKWINQNIFERKTPELNLDEVVKTLQSTAKRLTLGLKEVEEVPELFRNIIGTEPKKKSIKEASREALGYLLINQIVFYRVLSNEWEELPDIKPEEIESPRDLQEYFSKALDIDYEPIFVPNIASGFPSKYTRLVQNTIKMIYAIKPETVSHDILGKVFHSFIPLKIRKTLGAHYTKTKAADILANLCITSPESKVLDAACGSGTLLVSSYNRKKDLTTDFTGEDHQRFLGEELTGIDVMPFASHLSTIHLALQAPLQKTRKARIGVRDATSLSPGMTVKSLISVFPGPPQKKLPDIIEKKKVETGMGSKIIREEEFDLEPVDVVMMNPPFTRQETIAKFGPLYKKELRKRFSKRKNLIDGRMKYCYYFLLLADKFLKKGGRIGFVLPVTILFGLYGQKVRKWLLENYHLEYIIIRGDSVNFSEETYLREILLVAKKGKSQKNLTKCVWITDLSKVNPLEIKSAAKRIKSRRILKKTGFEIRGINQNTFDLDNLYRKISLKDPILIKKFWEKYKSSSKITEYKEIATSINHRDERPPYIRSYTRMCLDSPRLEYKRRDNWVIEKISENSLQIKNRFTRDEISLNRDILKPAFRRAVGRDTIDTTELDEFIVYGEEKKNAFEYFSKICNIEKINWNEWKEYIDTRTSNLCISTRIDISAPGTRLLSYFSEKNRAWSRASSSVIHGLNNTTAKIVVLWTNSTLNLLQMLIERKETRGAWMEFPKSTLRKMKVLNSSILSDTEKQKLVKIFDDIKKIPHPPIWKQLALNISRNDLSEKEVKELNEVFSEFQEALGKGFKPRWKLDKTILSIIGFSKKESEKMLKSLYKGLLKEIAILKRMM